jgi:ribosomal protein L18E
VPGKVLSEGSLDHKVNIAAIEFSRPALERIRDSNSSVVELKKMLKAGRVKIII